VPDTLFMFPTFSADQGLGRLIDISRRLPLPNGTEPLGLCFSQGRVPPSTLSGVYAILYYL